MVKKSLTPLNTRSQAPLNPQGLESLYIPRRKNKNKAETEDEMGIGARVRQLRHEWGLSQEAFGDLCGVSKGMVSQWESDTVTPPNDRLIKLREHKMFSLDWLLCGDKLAYTQDDKTALEISRQMSVQQRRAWYRVGKSFYEPEDDSEK